MTKSDNSSSDKWSMGIQSIKVDLRRAIIGGTVSAVVIALGGWLVGQASGSEAYQLFKTALPRTQSLSGTILLALGNILALMLTLLSLSSSMNVDIKWSHYQRVKQIAWTVTVTIIITVLGSLLMNIPIVESEKSTIQWFTYIYYAVLVFTSLLGGAFITITLLLYNTVRDMIGVLNPEDSHRLRHTEQEEE